jgi:hypothetical protein
MHYKNLEFTFKKRKIPIQVYYEYSSPEPENFYHSWYSIEEVFTTNKDEDFNKFLKNVNLKIFEFTLKSQFEKELEYATQIGKRETYENFRRRFG